MKTKTISVLLVFLLILSISGCSKEKKDLSLNNSNDNNKISGTISPTGTSTPTLDSNSEDTETKAPSNNSSLEAYKQVLTNKAEFFSTESKKKRYLNVFLDNNDIYETMFKATHFTVLDMDGDKVVVLELSVSDEPEFYEVLHYRNDTVYGNLIVYRGLEGLKEDGTYIYSNGAADNGIGKLKFKEDTLETDVLGYSKSSQENDNLILSYFIKDEPVTKESFDSFLKEQLDKKDVVWYEFSQENIETELSINHYENKN